MKTEIVDASPTRKEIKIEIGADEVRAEFDRLAQEYARVVTVPGFRKGHAPLTVVRTRYKKEIRGEVLQKLVPQAVGGAIEESGLQVIGEPDVHLDEEGLENFGQGPVRLHAHVEVMPEVKLGDYRGIEAARRVRPVTDEQVDQVIENLREASASLQPVEDRPSAEGDTVTADFQGRYIDTPEDEDVNVEDVDVVVGEECADRRPQQRGEVSGDGSDQQNPRSIADRRFGEVEQGGERCRQDGRHVDLGLLTLDGHRVDAPVGADVSGLRGGHDLTGGSEPAGSRQAGHRRR